MTTPKKPSDWIKKYVKGYKEEKLSIEQILGVENAIRERCGTRPLKAKSVKRMLNQAGLSTKAETKEPVAKVKPCLSCGHYVNDMCVYPNDLFAYYATLSDFERDLSRNQCKLKRTT